MKTSITVKHKSNLRIIDKMQIEQSQHNLITPEKINFSQLL